MAAQVRKDEAPGALFGKADYYGIHRCSLEIDQQIARCDRDNKTERSEAEHQQNPLCRVQRNGYAVVIGEVVVPVRHSSIRSSGIGRPTEPGMLPRHSSGGSPKWRLIAGRTALTL
jgi:hypothetical protein